MKESRGGCEEIHMTISRSEFYSRRVAALREEVAELEEARRISAERLYFRYCMTRSEYQEATREHDRLQQELEDKRERLSRTLQAGLPRPGIPPAASAALLFMAAFLVLQAWFLAVGAVACGVAALGRARIQQLFTRARSVVQRRPRS